MPRLLVVHHAPTPAVRSLADAVVAGARDDAIEGVEVVVREALDCRAADVLAADGLVLGTPANFGYLAREVHSGDAPGTLRSVPLIFEVMPG
ncbi:hypothetical protein [Nocardioides litoris]|uniref:hypothetical protein n=1 Tax=Nocardioides litoris TaxID=1926648 RepID=UPI001B87C568|nr:hypothetical protein [Nocardioides litoris]